MLRIPRTFVGSLAVSAVQASLARLGNTWQEVARSLQEDCEIDLNKQRGEFLADDNPLSEWGQQYFPRLQMCADESGFIGYLPDSGDEFEVPLTPAAAVFMNKWISNELWG